MIDWNKSTFSSEGDKENINTTTEGGTMRKTNKTQALADELSRYAGKRYFSPDCYNRHPGKGWDWSPSQTATKAAKIAGVRTQPCWHGSAPTPGTQMPAEVAAACREWIANWDKQQA